MIRILYTTLPYKIVFCFVFQAPRGTQAASDAEAGGTATAESLRVVF